MLQWPDKDPEEVLDYPVDFSSWLVSPATLNVTPGQCTVAVTSGVGLTVASVAVTTTTITAWLTGGTAGTTYTLKVTAKDTNGTVRTGVRRVKLKVKEK
jgi:hypothetical protein